MSVYLFCLLIVSPVRMSCDISSEPGKVSLSLALGLLVAFYICDGQGKVWSGDISSTLFNILKESKPWVVFYLAIKKYVSLNLKEYSTFVFILVFSNYPVLRYWKLAISKTGAKFTLAHQKNIKVSLITSSIDSNFNNEQYHQKIKHSCNIDKKQIKNKCFWQ